jgi:multidrug resistance efflux pump
LKEIYVKEGDNVTAGQPLALLENRELAQLHVSNTQRYQMARASMEKALGTDKPAEYKQYESQAQEYERRLERSKKDIEGMVLREHTSGTVLTRELDRRLGHLLKNGETFCEIARLDPMEIKMALTEKQVRYVQKGQEVDLQADAFPGRTIHGSIADVHPMLMAGDLPAALSARRAGDVPTGVDAKGREVPLEHTYEARVIVQNTDGLLRPGMTGHGKIRTGRRMWGRLVLQSVLDLISLDFRF